MTTKQCKKCKEEKPITEYSKGQAKCKSCRKHLRVEQYQLQKTLTREQLREEFKKKYDFQPGDNRMKIQFSDKGKVTFTDHFMEEEAFYEYLKDIEESINRDKKDKGDYVVVKAQNVPKEIKEQVIERNKDKEKYIRGIYLMIFVNKTVVKVIPPFDMYITY